MIKTENVSAMKTVASIISVGVVAGFSSGRNCGKKAMKKSESFGFNILSSIPFNIILPVE